MSLVRISHRTCLLLSFIILCIACGRQELNYEEMKVFLTDPRNGFLQEVIAGDAVVSVQFLPSEFMANQEANAFAAASLSPPSTDSLRQLYYDKLYFKLSITKNGRSIENSNGIGPDKTTALQNYLSSGIAGDITAVTEEGKAIRPIAISYVPFMREAASTSILVIFSRKEIEEAYISTIIYKDKLIAPGDLVFQFNEDDLKFLPALAN